MCRFFLSALLLVLATGALAGSRGVTVTLKAGEAPGAATAETIELYAASHALVVGIDNYTGGWPRLSNAVRDAKLVAGALRLKGFDVTLKTNLTSAQMERVFKEFFVVRGADPSARLFVWFAGHGVTQGGEGFLVPADAPRPDVGARFKLSVLPIRRFGEYVRFAESKHVFAVFDSCFAGTVFDSQRALPPSAVTRATTLPVRQFLTSGDTDQMVSDDGTFREVFIRALNGDEGSDANGDGYVTGSEIGLFLTDRITNLTLSRQTPRYGKLRDKNFDRGDFVFVLPERAWQPPAATLAVPTPTADKEILFWQSIQNSTIPEAFAAYLTQFPKGTFATLARMRATGLETQREQQFAALNEQLSVIKNALEASGQKVRRQEVEKAELTRRLNLALAERVQELSAYRSEFFGRLREMLGDHPGIRIVGDRFVFQSEVLFGSGSAEMGERGQAQMAQLAATFREIAETIPKEINWVLRVDGHTDKVPIATFQFPSNWELSTARAVSVVKFLMSQGIPADRLAATGFGEYQPLDPRDDEIAYRKNRRIELKLTQR